MPRLDRDKRNSSLPAARWLPALGVLVALSTVPALAQAGEHAAAQPPTLPSESPQSAEPAAPNPTSAAPTSTAAPQTVGPSPTSAPTAAPTTSPPNGGPLPAPRVDASLSLRGAAIWDGLEGKQVKLSMADGTTIAGTVVTNTGDAVAFARASDGMVVSVPKEEVSAINVRPQPVAGGASPGVAPGSRTLDSGRGQYAAGVALLSIGAPAALSGTVMLGLCAYCLYIHLPLLLPGIGMIIGGSIAIKRSKQRNEAFRKAWGVPLAGRFEMAPTLAFTRQGGEVGFVMRF